MDSEHLVKGQGKGRTTVQQTETVLNFIYIPSKSFDDAPISWGGFVTVYDYSYLLHDTGTIIFVFIC